jgi:F0F1-type ATP synthase assembly protein I
MTKTRTEAGRALMWALTGTALSLALVSAAMVGLDEGSGATKPLLVIAILLLAVVEGVLISGLRREAERVKRVVEGT